LPDPVFHEVRVTKFVNHLMYDGKKNTAFDIFYSALEVVKTKLPERRENSSWNMEESTRKCYTSSRSKISPCGRCYFPGANRNQTGQKRINLHEKSHHLCS